MPGEGAGILDELRVNLDFTVSTEFVSTELMGPFIDTGVDFESFDVNEDGFIDEEDDGRIRVGSDEPLFFLLRTRLRNICGTGALDDWVFWDRIREQFAYAPGYEDRDDGCADGICDGVGEDVSGACPIELSGLPQKRVNLSHAPLLSPPKMVLRQMRLARLACT